MLQFMGNSKMYLLSISFAIAFFSCCTVKKKPNDFHEQRIEMFEKTMAWPFVSKIVDSCKHLLPLLQQLHRNDQKYRENGDIAMLIDNRESQLRLDSINKAVVDSLFNIHGFLTKKQLGVFAHRTIVFILIHADTTFKMKYAPMMDLAFKQNNILKGDYALFVDKLLFQKSLLQKYGTQSLATKKQTILYPFNPDSIYKNRLSVGLKTPLFKSKEDSLKYLKTLPEIIKLRKIRVDSTALQ
jgi:hypothetical protein